MIRRDSFQRLSEHTGYFRGSTNVGLAISGPELFLIDSGDCDEDGEMLARELRKLFPGKLLKAVINTHGHSDHCGGNSALKKAFGCEIWAPRAERIFIENPGVPLDIYWGGRHFTAGDVPVFRTIEPCGVDRPLDEGELDLGEICLKLLALPGHFYDQLGIVVTDKSSGNRTFFMGDAFFGVEMIKRYWIPFMQDPYLFRESVCRIEDESADCFIPSHGTPLDRWNLPAMAELNKIMTLEAESLIVKIVRKGPATCEEILKAVADYAGLSMKLSQYVLIGSTIRSYVSRLYNDGRLRYEVKDNRLLWLAAE